MARLVKYLLLGALLLVLACPLIVYFLVLSDQPVALEFEPASQQELMRLQQLVAAQVAQADPQGHVNLRLNQQDVNTAIEFGLLTAAPPMIEAVGASIGEQELRLEGSVSLPLEIARRFINYQVTLVPDGRTPHISHLQLGSLSLPQSLAGLLEQRAYDLLAQDERLSLARRGWESIENIAIEGGQLHVAYRMTPATIKGLARQHSKLLLEQVETSSVEYYLAELEPISRKSSSERYPLAGMLAPAFELAQQRCADACNPIMENSAALLSLAMYTADPAILEMMGLSERFGYPARKLELTLHRRPDLASHFLTSALISLFAGDQVALLMGIQKELDDSQYQTGFDIADLMADKAGIRFAEKATANDASARRLQEQLVQLLYDDEIMPSPDKLPAIDEGELARMNDKQLDAQLQRIERQLDALLSGIAIYGR